MKILAIQAVEHTEPDKQSAVDIWRIWRPLKELEKHVDWQIDYQPTFIKDIEKYADQESFTKEEVEQAAEHLGSYDIVYSSYYTNPMTFALTHVVSQRYGTQFVMDIDDDMFAIDPSNPVWMSLSHENVYHMQRMIRNSPWLTTTNEHLAQVMRDRSEVNGEVVVVKNYISDAYHNERTDNDGVVIGYIGGSSHYEDLHKSGVLPAIQKLMLKYKHVRFQCAGLPVDYYLPRKRSEVLESKRGLAWTDELFPTLNFDIAVAPVLDTPFARSKSNIKWQETTRMGAAFVASNILPYRGLPIDLVDNTEQAWYDALEKLVLDEDYRKSQVKKSQDELKKWRLEDHWQEYKAMFEMIKEKANG